MLPLEGCSSIVTGVVLRMLIMTAAVFISIILCVIVLVSSPMSSGSYSITMSLSDIFPSLFFLQLLLHFRRMVVCFWSFLDLIVDTFVGIGRLAGRLVVGNHSLRVGILTLLQNSLTL